MIFDFYTKVAGVTFENRQQYVKQCYAGQKLELIRDKFNVYDKNAVAVYAGEHQVGFLSKELAKSLASKMDSGRIYVCYVKTVTGGQAGNSYGLNIGISEEPQKNPNSTPTYETSSALHTNYEDYNYGRDDIDWNAIWDENYISLDEYYGTSDWEDG